MLDQDERLIRCFASVFPTLTPEQIEARPPTQSACGIHSPLSRWRPSFKKNSTWKLSPTLFLTCDSFRAFREYLSAH